MKITHTAAMAIATKINQLCAELNVTLREGEQQGMEYDSEIATMHSVTGSFPQIKIAALVRPSNLLVE